MASRTTQSLFEWDDIENIKDPKVNEDFESMGEYNQIQSSTFGLSISQLHIYEYFHCFKAMLGL